MPSIEFKVWCPCGNSLCNQTTNVKGGINVGPCGRCLDDIREGGYNDGWQEGYDEGYNEGYYEGYHSSSQNDGK